MGSTVSNDSHTEFDILQLHLINNGVYFVTGAPVVLPVVRNSIAVTSLDWRRRAYHQMPSSSSVSDLCRGSTSNTAALTGSRTSLSTAIESPLESTLESSTSSFYTKISSLGYIISFQQERHLLIELTYSRPMTSVFLISVEGSFGLTID